MMPPRKKRTREYNENEINWMRMNFGPEKCNEILNLNEDYDIPVVSKLEREIEEYYKKNKLEGKPFDVYKKFLSLTDKFNELFENYSVCRKGCGGCCKIAVQISEMEKNIIKRYLEKNKIIKNYICNKNPQKPIIKNGLFGGNYTGIECPFLENYECKIYSVRPYKCRKFISFDVDCKIKYQKLYESNENFIMSGGQHFHISSEANYINIYVYYCNKTNREYKDYREFNDIRDYFSKI